MPYLPLLVLGTHNVKKGGELVSLLDSLPIQVRTLADFPQAIDVIEDGTSFAENAEKKACQQARHLDCWVLGEDSGLCVDALEGQPGIYSARFSGSEATDEKNNALLLEKMRAIEDGKRQAHYVCHIVISDPEGIVHGTSTGRCQGWIRRMEVGHNGFGYDPLFEVREYHRTFGELGGHLKSAISHRARAVSLIVPKIRKLLRRGVLPTA